MSYVESILKDLFEDLKNSHLENERSVNLKGWVRTNRNNGSIGFIELSDGTTFLNIQLVYSKDNVTDFDAYTHLLTGSAISVDGKVILTPENKQPFEIHVDNITLLGAVSEDYPLQKKRHTFEFLRDIAYLRPRTNTFYALARVRSRLSFAMHSWFNENNFYYIHTPIITGIDSEGAGQVFDVNAKKEDGKPFFDRPVHLTVSGQLHVEPFALAMRNVYTFGPTFRAENSNTPRHASEFWMIEPEMAFCDIHGALKVVESLLRHCIEDLLIHSKDELNFFNAFVDKGLLNRLHQILENKWKVLTYTDAVEILKKAVEEGHHFDNKHIFWGMDLQSEHERYITETVEKGPTWIIDYPKEAKAFYMKQNPDGKTVAAYDLLVPEIGELIGGSQREENYDLLKKRMEECHLLKDDSALWYLNTRKFGGCVHSGFGIGFDRFLMLLTGLSNIRDVQLYPRTANQVKY